MMNICNNVINNAQCGATLMLILMTLFVIDICELVLTKLVFEFPLVCVNEMNNI